MLLNITFKAALMVAGLFLAAHALAWATTTVTTAITAPIVQALS
jgi:hypothetical protein